LSWPSKRRNSFTIANVRLECFLAKKALSGRLTAVFATRHEIFLVDLLPIILPDNAFASASREKRLGVLGSLDLCEFGAAKVPNTDLDISGQWKNRPGIGFLSNDRLVADSCRNRHRSGRWHDVARWKDSFRTLWLNKVIEMEWGIGDCGNVNDSVDGVREDDGDKRRQEKRKRNDERIYIDFQMCESV
jgi:hypothetical protein